MPDLKLPGGDALRKLALKAAIQFLRAHPELIRSALELAIDAALDQAEKQIDSEP